jgi:hypothetical protein
MFGCGGHLGWRSEMLYTILEEDHEIHIKIFSSETTGPIATKFGGMLLGWPLSKIVSGDPDFQPRWPPS